MWLVLYSFCQPDKFISKFYPFISHISHLTWDAPKFEFFISYLILQFKQKKLQAQEFQSKSSTHKSAKYILVVRNV